ncbi:hypothetical protein OH805_17930 [Streptomyces sp. NBC_00879]|uniref:hypothetical protein n=1 Tax=Streptomyces sp. NBC_00879 TaxID=2975855 RepID=UPI003868B8C9|nr:hypothetical protein OH805_17930 [Streptomyces sp. NBC_00879]
MRNVRRWRLFRLIVLAVVTAGTVTVAPVPVAATGTGAASAPTAEGSVSRPDDDPFYSVPRGIDLVRDGAVLRWRRLPAGAMATPAPAKVWQLLYKTTDNHGRPTATVGTLPVPTTHRAAKGPRHWSPIRFQRTAWPPSARRPTCCEPEQNHRARPRSGSTSARSRMQWNAAGR